MIGERANTKHVPDWVFESGAVGASQFLAGYLSTDGCVKKPVRGWAVHFDTVSRRLAEDVQLLLLRIGVIATVSDGYQLPRAPQPIYRIAVLGFAANLRRFAAAVKPGGRKGELLERMVTDLPENVTNDSLFGLPPEIGGLLYNKSKHLRQQGRKLENATEKLFWRPSGRRPRRDTCARFAVSLKDETLGVWANSDLLWEEVTSIVPSGEEEVFDITVPGCGNFLANGIVAHNSGGVEAEADVVCFLYNGDLYARQESPGPPITPGHRDMVELIIAKHRNGPVGTVRVGFQPVYTRFVNMAQLGDADAPDDAPYDAPYDPQANAPYDPQANAPYAPPGDAPLPPTRGSAASLAQAAISAGRYTRPTHGSAGHTGQRHAAGGQGAGKASDKRGKNAARDYALPPNHDLPSEYDLPAGEDE